MGAEWPKGSAYPEEWTTRRERERRMQQLARRQRLLITTFQLQNLGYTKSTIHDRVAAGRLHPTPFTAVYTLAPPPLGRLETIKAAALASGPHSLPSHWSAAEVLRIAEPPLLPVHVTRPTGNGRRRRLLAIHRSIVPARDTVGRDGIICTSAARTVFDLTALAEPEEVERVLIAADSLRILNRVRLEELVDGSPGRRGVRLLRSLLAADSIRVRSDTETEMLFVCRGTSLADPEVNGVVAGIEVDFHWPELRLVVEVDGWRFHGGRERANADRDRDQRLLLSGWTVVRFTRDQIAADPAGCARRLTEIAAKRRGSGSAGQGRRSRSGLGP